MLSCRNRPRQSPGAVKRRKPPGAVVEMFSASFETPKKFTHGGSNERMRAGTTKRRSDARATQENEMMLRPRELVEPKMVSRWPVGSA